MNPLDQMLDELEDRVYVVVRRFHQTVHPHMTSERLTSKEAFERWVGMPIDFSCLTYIAHYQRPVTTANEVYAQHGISPSGIVYPRCESSSE